MTRLTRIGLAAALLLGGAAFAMAQNGPLTGAYPPATKNPNLYGYYHHPYYHHRYNFAPTDKLSGHFLSA
jgi:hypothetical protein